MKTDNVVTNTDVADAKKIELAEKIISKLQKELAKNIKYGYGPFGAAVYRGNKLIAKSFNTVVLDGCSNHHAEINAICVAQQKLKTYDLSDSNLSLYITAEPCIMCVGAIMWSGISNVFYSVPSKTVEKLTGFDEGFKQNWLKEFKKRGISVYGNICADTGVKVLKQYMDNKNIVYAPRQKK